MRKDPRVAKQVLEEPNTRKPEMGYRLFRRLHGFRGGKDFLSFSSHKEALYKRTRTESYKALMKRKKATEDRLSTVNGQQQRAREMWEIN